MLTIKSFSIHSFILSFSALLFFSSCEDPIQVELDKGEPLVTVDAFIDNMRKTQTIRLTYADDYFSQKASTGINGATVIVKDITAGLNFNFTDKNNGNYTYSLSPTDTLIKEGHQYELTVTHQGDNYTANSTAFRTTKVDSILVEYREAGAFGGEAGYDAGFLGMDRVGPIPDYYWIRSYRNNVVYNKGGDINIAIEGADGLGSDGFIFTPQIARGILPGGTRIDKFDSLRVEIHSISEQAYYFLFQVRNQTTNTGLFATTPENVKTNISTTSKTKVVGWFNTSMVGWKQVMVQ